MFRVAALLTFEPSGPKECSSNRAAECVCVRARVCGSSSGECWEEKGSACSSRFSHVHLCATPWTIARQLPLSLGFSRQEYWSGLPCPGEG